MTALTVTGAGHSKKHKQLDSHGKILHRRELENMTSEAKKASKAKYDAKTAVYISMKLNKNTDQDIIGQLEKAENKQAFLKAAIREYIKKTGD